MALDPAQFTGCPEKWENMTPTERGRLCAKCSKDIVDFRAASTEEILRTHSRASGICGLYSITQFARPASTLAAVAAAAAFGVMLNPGFSEGSVAENAHSVEQGEVVPSDSVVVRGRVRDSASGSPIAGAQVHVKGTRRGTITNAHGEYKFAVPDSTAEPIHVIAEYIGYTPKSVFLTAPADTIEVDFALTQSLVQVVGIYVVGEPRPPEPRRRLSTWQKIWRFITGK